MRWVITKDIINADDEKGRHWIGKGSNAHHDLREKVKAMPRDQAELFVMGVIFGWRSPTHFVPDRPDPYPYEFRLLDDDRIVCHEGRCGDIANAPGDQAFAPLDWNESIDGCTIMEYRKVGETEWQVL